MTVGSDAHKIEHLAKDFDIAFNILEDIGFNEITIFHERKPEFVKIKELRK